MNQNEQKQVAETIRKQYTPKEYTQLDALQTLDAKVKNPVKIFSYVFGTVSALIMGGGMSLIMTDISNIIGMTDPTLPGIVIGIIGLILAIINYPLHKYLLNTRKKKYADEIIALTDALIQQNMQNH